MSGGRWSPRPLIAPDGRAYTPTSRGEEVRLRTGHGYRPKTDVPSRSEASPQPQRQDTKTAKSAEAAQSVQSAGSDT